MQCDCFGLRARVRVNKEVKRGAGGSWRIHRHAVNRRTVEWVEVIWDALKLRVFKGEQLDLMSERCRALNQKDGLRRVQRRENVVREWFPQKFPGKVRLPRYGEPADDSRPTVTDDKRARAGRLDA